MAFPPLGLPVIGGQLFYGNGLSPETWALITNMGNLTGLTLSAQVIDVTNNNTTNPWRSKLTTLLDSGQMSFDLFFIPSDPGHQTVMTLFANRGQSLGAGSPNPGVPIAFKYVFPDLAGTTWFFQGFISKFSMAAATQDVFKASVVIDAVGIPTFPEV